MRGRGSSIINSKSYQWAGKGDGGSVKRSKLKKPERTSTPLFGRKTGVRTKRLYEEKGETDWDGVWGGGKPVAIRKESSDRLPL